MSGSRVGVVAQTATTEWITGFALTGVCSDFDHACECNLPYAFSMEQIAGAGNGMLGSRYCFRIPSNADALGQVYADLTLPSLNVRSQAEGGTGNSESYRWIDYPGEFSIQDTSLNVGPMQVDQFNGEWIHICNGLNNKSASQQRAYNIMVGQQVSDIVSAGQSNDERSNGDQFGPLGLFETGLIKGPVGPARPLLNYALAAQLLGNNNANNITSTKLADFYLRRASQKGLEPTLSLQTANDIKWIGDHAATGFGNGAYPLTQPEWDSALDSAGYKIMNRGAWSNHGNPGGRNPSDYAIKTNNICTNQQFSKTKEQYRCFTPLPYFMGQDHGHVLPFRERNFVEINVQLRKLNELVILRSSRPSVEADFNDLVPSDEQTASSTDARAAASRITFQLQCQMYWLSPQVRDLMFNNEYSVTIPQIQMVETGYSINTNKAQLRMKLQNPIAALFFVAQSEYADFNNDYANYTVDIVKKLGEQDTYVRNTNPIVDARLLLNGITHRHSKPGSYWENVNQWRYGQGNTLPGVNIMSFSDEPLSSCPNGWVDASANVLELSATVQGAGQGLAPALAAGATAPSNTTNRPTNPTAGVTYPLLNLRVYARSWNKLTIQPNGLVAMAL